VRALLVLAGTNTYTGVTVVAAGTLALNGTQPGAVTVAAAAVLSGTGIVQGAVAAGGGSTVQPGHLGVAGALTVGGAVFADGAQVSVLAGGTSALLRVTGVDGLTVPAGAGQLLVNVLSTSRWWPAPTRWWTTRARCRAARSPTSRSRPTRRARSCT
jgi:autotransporter-associated beta strand protein